MRIVKLTDETRKDLLSTLLKRSPNQYGEYEETVARIVDDIRERGDAALFEYTEKFDHITLTPDTVKVTEQEIEEAYGEVDPQLLDVIRKALVNIRSYHEKQRRYSWFDSKENGIMLGQKISPLQRAGVYVPGGKAVYPSSVLMNVVPAKVAGVPQIIMTTPCRNGKVSANTLVAAHEAGVDEIYKV
ncbi:MAG: histidinol dehydrogenase, partial [Lachnospiraceae bacterium]|nr:histidinol dehydrogenase [Lachnospiraceae bacterium]